MRRLIPIVVLSACTAEVQKSDPPEPDAVLEALVVTPSSLLLIESLTATLSVEGTYSDGAVEDLTTVVEWRSSATTVATVDGGLVEAVGAGTAVITAEHVPTGLTATCDVEVDDAVIESIAVTPATVSIAIGRTQALTATATLSNGNDIDVTTAATWETSNVDVVTVSATGEIEAIEVGGADVDASLDGRTGTAGVTVTAAEVDSIELVPASLTVAVGLSATMEAHATLTDGGDLEVTHLTIWESDAPGIARIDDAGLVSGVSVGDATVTVTHAATGVEQTAPVTVTAAALERIDVTPANSDVGLGRNRQYTATGVYSDDSTEVLTAGIDWDTLDHGIATVDSNGLVYGVAFGSTTVTATDTATNIVGSTDVEVGYAAEGAVDAPVEITPPYVGQVDTTSSYYVVTGLTPGLLYTIEVVGNDDIDLHVHDDLFITRICSSTTFGNQESCDAVAPASGSLWIQVNGFGASTNPGAQFTITVTAGPPAPDLIIEITGVSGNGSLITFDYTITNSGGGTVDLFGIAIAFWADRASAPDPGVMGDHPAFAPSATLGAGQSHSATAGPFGSSATSGTAWATVDYSETVPESDDDNNVSPGFAW